MLNMRSAAGKFLAYPAASPNYADLSNGMGYGIALVNTTAADITSGTVTISAADALPDDHCTPGTFGPLPAVPPCDAPPGTDAGNAVIMITAANPIRAHSQCTYSAPCPKQFLQVAGVPAGVTAIVVVTPLRRTDFSVGTVTGDIESMQAA